MHESDTLPFLADEIGLIYLRHGTLVARTAFEPLLPATGQEPSLLHLRASTAWFLGGREIRQAALAATGLAIGEPALERASAIAHMRNLFVEDEGARLLVPLAAPDAASIGSLLAALDEQIETGDIEPDRIIVELPAGEDGTQLGAAATELRMRGFAIGLGDFGPAGSSAALIEAVAPEIVRLDMQWVRLADGIDPSHRLLSSLVALLREGGRTTLLGGIESAGDHDTALKIGVDLLAGPLLAPPFLAGTDSPHRPGPQDDPAREASGDNVIPLADPGRHHGR
ncbi:EAL domain-containing protein [Chelativorans sp. ZYF759]|uniref:EAL domain-containing protein n=1 Tax=Chelativorans sp. ZYF759 TaxID=2692213 RepID=UPI00145DE6AF|nr:EAL domain-containing protein [Chelativorans sp. ZYF759]NMG40586.1 EAL domain-containing protein [Chelativorans sp. ZYF759]